MIIINVKYMSATNTRGSYLKATMRGHDGNLSASVPFNYASHDEGTKDAARKVLAKWCANVEYGDNETWVIKIVGDDYRHETIVTAHVTHEVSA